MKALAFLLAGVVPALCGVALAAGEGDADASAPAETFAQVCANCHGPTGRGMASFPRIAGGELDYIASRLRQYRAGEKVGPNTPLMAPHAANLTDAQIDALAAYISADLSAE